MTIPERENVPAIGLLLQIVCMFQHKFTQKAYFVTTII